MDFDFSQDQKLLADQVRRYLDDSCNPAAVRQVLDGSNVYLQPVWQGLAQMGLVGTAVPEKFGGTGAGYLELCQVAQQLGAHLAPVPFTSSVYLVIEALLLCGSTRQQEEQLPLLSSGERIGALAMTEGLTRLSPDQLTTTVSDGKLSGVKSIVSDGSIADMFVVLASEAGTPGLYLVDAGASGVQRVSVESVDLTRDTARVEFSSAPCERLEDSSWENWQRLLDRAAILQAFEQLGGAQAALDMATAYAQERFAFGRAIGSFQAIKHMLADMYVAMKLAENNCYYAAWALANDAPDLPLAAATARVGATQAYQQCAKDNIQVHGGMGFTWEFDCHLYYRRSNYQALELGALGEWEARLVEHLPLQASA